MKSFYDYVIVGTGPAGLALAQCLAHEKKVRILLIEGTKVVGGCHRVDRVGSSSLFTEHGPRVYFNNYNNFSMLLRNMGASFETFYTPYFFTIQGELLRHVVYFKFHEIVHLTLAFLYFLFSPTFGKQITLLQFATKHDFTRRTKDVLDRYSRMTDGAGIERYTLWQFFATMNQQLFAKIYQPRLPNDKGLFPFWMDYLQQQEGIDVVLDHQVIHLTYDETTDRVQSIWAVDGEKHNTIEIKCKQVVLAVPPHAMKKILQTSHDRVKNAFMPFTKLDRFVSNTDYNVYVCITFHWKDHVDTPKAHGFPVGEWGVIFIVLSDYMDMKGEYSKTLVSTCVSYLNKPSFHTNKTANESDAEEIKAETFRQLKMAMPSLTDPDQVIISPRNTRVNGKWKQYDVSYVSSSKEKAMKNKGSIQNLYNVGTHNGNSQYALTTMESATENSIFLAHILDPSTRSIFPIQKLMTLRLLLLRSFLVLLCTGIMVMILIFFVKKIMKKKNKKSRNK